MKARKRPREKVWKMIYMEDMDPFTGLPLWASTRTYIVGFNYGIHLSGFGISYGLHLGVLYRLHPCDTIVEALKRQYFTWKKSLTGKGRKMDFYMTSITGILILTSILEDICNIYMYIHGLTRFLVAYQKYDSWCLA